MPPPALSRRPMGPQRAAPTTPSRRFLLLVVAAALLVALWGWMGVREHDARAADFAHSVEHGSRHLADYVRVRIANAEAIASLRAAGRLADAERFRRHAQIVQRRLGGYFAINWIDAEGTIRWVAPLEPNRAAIGRNVFQHPQAGITARRARETLREAVTGPIRLFQGRDGFASYLPVQRNGTLLGFVNPVFDLHHVLRASFGASFEHRLALRIEGSDGHAFESPDFPAAWRRGPRARMQVELPDATWTIRAAPTEAALAETRPSPLRHMLLALGLLVLGLLALLEERRAAQFALATELDRAKQRLARAVDESPDLVTLLSPEGRIHDPNASARKLLGDEAEGSELLGYVPTRHRETLRRALQRAARTGEVVRTSVPLGPAARIHDITLAPLRDERGDVEALLLHARDEQDRIDVRKQLARSQRLEAVGRLAGGVAHDFNNVLAAITAMASVLREEYPEAAEDLDAIVEAAERGSALTRKLLAFARYAPSEERRDPGRIDRAVRAAEKLIRGLLGQETSLRIELPEAPLWTPLPEAEAEQVLMNLVINAIDAMEGRGGTLHVSLCAEPHHAVLRIRDEGVGMPPEVLEHAFEPFFTTKAPERGSGLGLASVYGLVRSAGGEVHIESRPGAGTTVEVRLPRLDAPRSERKASDTTHRTLGDVRILLVEDDEVLRRTMARWLRERGATVFEAEDGLDALAELRRHGSVDVVVTDVVMPRMGGIELLDTLRSQGFSAPVLLVSGYARHDRSEEDSLAAAAPLLHKPFRPETLLETVLELLDTSSGASTTQAPTEDRGS